MTVLTYVIFGLMTAWPRQSEGATSTLFNMSSLSPFMFSSASPGDTEETEVNLGVQFSPVVAGFVTAVLFIKNNSASIERVCSLFTSEGRLLGSAKLPRANETIGRSWQICRFDRPIALEANVDYVASIWTHGYLRSVDWFNNVDKRSGDLVLRSRQFNGRYFYNTTVLFPSETFNANYWVDVRFENGTLAPTPAPTPPAPTLEATSASTSSQATIDALSTTTTMTRFNVTNNVSQSNNFTGTAAKGPMSDLAMWIGIGVGLCCLLFLLLLLLLVCLARHRKKKEMGEVQLQTPTRFDADEVDPGPDVEMDRYSDYGGLAASSIIEQTDMPAGSRTQMYAAVPRNTIFYDDCTSVLR